MAKSFPNYNLSFRHGKLMRGSSVKGLQAQLSKRGFLSPSMVDGVFGLETEKAVRSYQITNNITATGVVNKNTWNSIFKSNDVNSDRIADQVKYDKSLPDTVIRSHDKSRLPHHEYDGEPKRTPFFNPRNTNELRKSDMEIRVDFGANSHLNKKIKHVFPRSVGIEVDASGNPIYEVYEFIAQDIEESDNKFNKK